MFFETLLIIILIIIISIVIMYNGLVRSRNAVKNSWSGIDVWLKRREDLIPNLVRTVKGYAKHEKKLLEEITRLRIAMLNSQKDIKRTAAADDMLNKTLKSLFAIAENYPKLRANENFLELQKELSNTENEIAATRRIYNNNVRDYNTSIDSFPQNIISRLFGFEKVDFFNATANERKQVKISIDDLS
jgi:LemA protein